MKKKKKASKQQQQQQVENPQDQFHGQLMYFNNHSPPVPVQPAPPPTQQQQQQQIYQHQLYQHQHKSNGSQQQLLQQQLLQQQLLQHQHQQQQQHQQHQHQHQHQSNGGQQQQQQHYNMNSSDYSSSTYHIYDQISDLIIIKQQRMERKRQQEQKRKIILFGLAAILLVGSLVFLLIQSLISSPPQPPQEFLLDPKVARGGYKQQQQQQQQIDTISIAPTISWGEPGATWTPMLAPPMGGLSRLPANQQPNPSIIFQPSNFNFQQQNQFRQAQQTLLQTMQQQPQQPQMIQTLKQQQQQMQPLPASVLASSIPTQQAHSQPSNLANDNNQNVNDNRTKVIDSCGEHGTIVSNQNVDSTPTIQCKCDYGYSGDQCQLPISFQPAISNIQPNPLNNMRLFNRCQLIGCAGNGQCNMQGKCDCNPGYFGDDCTQLPERQCNDGIDNDKDGLVDCADSECCSDKACKNSTLCMTSPDPLDILMRKQPPPPTSSFFQRMQFLIEKLSSQLYSHPTDFNDSRASVIRGRVTYLKQGVTGVRVSVTGQHRPGVTLTREGGYFDLMVNGGGAVVIEFRREPFATHQKTVRVPWNEIVLIEPVELSLDASNSDLSASLARPASPLPEPDAPTCTVHNYRLMRPIIVTAPKSSRRSHQHQSRATPVSRAVILQESGLVQQSILLPASGGLGSAQNSQEFQSAGSNESVSLVYISNRANEFMSTINIQLVPSIVAEYQTKLPDELRLVHLKIVIEGNLFEQVFEPQPNLTFTYAWNRRNVYKQKSYGLSTATVSVGYEYDDCRHVIWTSKQIKLPGHDLSISDIGQQWNLNIHHRYNYRDSILQRGDGQNFNLKTDKPRVVQPVIGDGYQRQAVCSYCDGATSVVEQRLLKPQSLISAPDGSLYVGDFNLIRKVEFASSGAGVSSSSSSSPSAQSAPSATTGGPANKQLLGFEGARKTVVRTILDLSTTRVPSKYSLALNLADNKLYMSDVDRYQIYMIREQASGSNRQGSFESNDTSASDDQSLQPVVGSGVRCQLEDRANCGDGHSAKIARLIEPKALTFDLNNRMYIADGPNVRMVDAEGKIYTILGNYAATRHTKFPCTGEAVPMHKFVPKNPIDLAISPIDDTLHILDDNVVFKITQDKRVQIVAGRLAHCPQGAQPENRKLRATEVFLQFAQSITFNQNGDLFVSEDDQKQLISRVLLVSPEEDSISLYAGLPIDNALLKQHGALPTVDANYFLDSADQESQQLQDKQRSSNLLPLSQTIKASDYKFNSIAAITVDQQGRLLVADKMQLRIVSIEPDLPKMNAAGEYELQSPDNSDELLVFNRFGHHIATREISSGQTQRQSNKYTFQYNVNTSFGQLASVSYLTGNKISIYRDGPHHSVKMIETAFGGQCKLDINRNGQVHSITTIAPNTTKTNFSYHVDGGLLKQSRDQASGELFDFQYDEFGRAIEIIHSSPKLPAPVECRFNPTQRLSYSLAPRQDCSNLIVAE